MGKVGQSCIHTAAVKTMLPLKASSVRGLLENVTWLLPYLIEHSLRLSKALYSHSYNRFYCLVPFSKKEMRKYGDLIFLRLQNSFLKDILIQI